MRAFRIPSLFSRPIVITNADFRFVVAEQLRERGIEADIVLEPSAPRFRSRGRGRRPCSQPNVIATPSCSCWPPTTSSASPTNSAKPAGAPPRPRPQGQIVTFGIEPTHPATNYGYIRPGEKLNGAPVHAVEAFVEKPDAATAATYVADRLSLEQRQFPVSRRDHAGEIERFEPEMAEAAKAAVAGLTRDLDFLRLAAEPFARAPKKSIDYAVMERTKLAAVVPADLGWSDVGSWSAVWDVLDHDAAGNATEGPVVMLDSRNSLVRSENSVLTTVVGLDDVIVVSTADAVLVSARVQGRAGQGAGRAAEGAKPSRGGRASPHLSPLGLLPGHRHCPALPGEAHRREARQQAVAAEALPSLRALGRGQGNGRGHARHRRAQRARKRIRSISRSGAFIGSPIPARFRSN